MPGDRTKNAQHAATKAGGVADSRKNLAGVTTPKGGVKPPPRLPQSTVGYRAHEDNQTLADPRPNGFQGVGGTLQLFRLSVAIYSKDDKGEGWKPSDKNFVDFELAPARRSFFERQGQAVPGVGGGLENSITTNIAKLNVPGARQVQQVMGMGGEYLEFVGAFVGFDGKYDFEDTDLANAWEKSQKLAQLTRRGRELILEMKWTDPGSSGTHWIGFDDEKYGSLAFRGKIEKLTRIYATAQRVYYRILLAVNNDYDYSDNSSNGVVYKLPNTLQSTLQLQQGKGGRTAGAGTGTNLPADIARIPSGEGTGNPDVPPPPFVTDPVDAARMVLGQQDQIDSETVLMFEQIKSMDYKKENLVDAEGKMKPGVIGPERAADIQGRLVDLKSEAVRSRNHNAIHVLNVGIDRAVAYQRVLGKTPGSVAPKTAPVVDRSNRGFK